MWKEKDLGSIKEDKMEGVVAKSSVVPQRPCKIEYKIIDV